MEIFLLAEISTGVLNWEENNMEFFYKKWGLSIIQAKLEYIAK